MPVTIREYLGDEKIAQLEGMGFLPNLIADMAKRQYMQDRQAKRNELADSGLDGKLVQGIMRGEISEEEARNAQKFEDFGAKKHGWGLGAAKAVAGIANAAERVSDFINPFYEGKRDEKGDYVYQNAIEKGLRPKIKSAEKLRDDYEKATGETSWGSRATEIGTEMVADPLNFFGGIGLLSKGGKLAQFGKKSLYFAGTGAASGGVMALGEGKNDEETLKNMGYGAAGGFVLGHTIDQSVQGISKLIAKRRTSKAANEADAIEHAENSEFIGGGNEGGGGTGAAAGELKTAQTMTAREFAIGEAGLDEATAAKVVKEAAQGKEKSDFVDAGTYADIVKFKNFENQRDYAKAYGEQIEAAKQSLESAREQSAVRYADTQRAINEYQKQGMSASATRELINAKFKPSADEINYTRAYNGGADVDPRLAGQGIFYALEKDIAAQAYTPEIYAARLKQRGFSDESAQAFTQAYVQKDINIAKDWANGKAAEVYENNVRAQVASEIKAKNEAEGEGWTMRDGGEAKQYAEHKFEVEKWINDLSGVLSDEWIANLKSLALKHPEMFRSEADVFRVIKEIKDNPTHFFKNNNDRNALLVKNLKEGKSGEIAVRKTDGQIVHATINNEKRLDRLQKRNKENLGNGELSKVEYSDGARRLPRHSDQSRTMPTAKAESAADDAGIIQTFTRPGSKLENQGLGYQDETIISQKGNLVNEKEANGLRDSVSSIGDNASRADGRQASDEQILRQGRRDTTNASQTKRPAQSDVQMEQQWAAKADGEADAAAATKQVVGKQASGANIGGGLAANSNAHLGSGLVAGSLNSIDEDGNFSPERFAAGFLAGLAGGKAVATGLRKMTPKLYNKILGAAEKMPQMANSNPRLLGKLYSNGKDVSLNSFAGEKAITANVGKLDQAKAMLEKGADEVEIWQKTGWFKDKDGAWKFEIGDGKAKLNPNFQSGGRLGELLEHEELFKAYPELKDVRVVKIGDETPDGAALSVKDAAQKEKRGIYNVTYNDKTATLVRQDLQKIDDALILEKGSNKKGGAVHIKKHLDPGAQGAITQGEFLSIGKNIREYLQKYKKPFIDESGGRIYEWADENGVKFRVVVYEKADGISASHPNSIISFYSNRNLKKPMEFRNPQVKYDVNLKEWHKDSAPITKNPDGSPKVFYHGTKVKQLEEFKDEFDKTGVGFWFSPDKETAKEYGRALLKVYIKAKNIMDFIEPTKKDMDVLKIIQDKMFWSQHVKLRDTNNETLFRVMADLKSNGVELKRLLRKYNYDGIKVNKDMFVVFDSAQVKHVKNDGNFSDSPNIYKSGKEGYYSPAKNEIGLRDLGDKSTLMHEVQHAIQEIEGFARGGNTNKIESSLWFKSGELAYKLKKLAPPPEFYVLEKKRSSLSSKLMLEADKIIEQNPLMEDDIIKNTFNKKNFDKLKLRNTKELKEFKDVLTKYHETDNALGDMVKNHPIFKERKKISDKLDALVKKDPYEEYKKLHGEAEARNVQNRLNLDGKAHPHETFDVNPNETIVNKEDGISYSRKIEEIKREHPNVEKELDESIAAMRKESFNDSNFKNSLLKTIDDFIAETKGHPASGDFRGVQGIKSLPVRTGLARPRSLTTQELGKSVNLSGKQLAVLENDIKNADFKVISDSKIYFDKIGKDGDKKRFFVDIAQDGSLRVDAYAKSQVDNIPVKQSALEELAGTGDAARLKGMSFEVKAAYRNELDPIKKEAILKTAELNKLKKAAQSGDKAAVAKFEEFKAKNLDENGNIKDGLSLC